METEGLPLRRLRLPDSTIGGTSASMVHIPGSAEVVRFSGHPSKFVSYRGVCANPACNCRKVVVGFDELGDPGIEKNGLPATFDVWLNIDTGREVQTQQRAAAVDGLAAEYVASLTPGIQTQLKEEYEDYRAMLCNAAEYRMSREEIRSKSLVSAAAVFCGRGPQRKKLKRSFVFTFEYEGKGHIVEDSYCINPHCRCEEAVLEVWQRNELAAEPANLFSVHMQFDGDFEIEHTRECTEEQARRSLESWSRNAFRELDVLQWRYERIKETGARLLGEAGWESEPVAPITGAPVVGPNRPCPCGSGRKYKKCCGRLG